MKESFRQEKRSKIKDMVKKERSFIDTKNNGSISQRHKGRKENPAIKHFVPCRGKLQDATPIVGTSFLCSTDSYYSINE